MKNFTDAFAEYLQEKDNRARTLGAIMRGTIAAKVTLMRHERKLNQTQLAKMVGVTQPMIAKWESGDYNFSINQLAKVCVSFNIEMDKLLNNSPKSDFFFSATSYNDLENTAYEKDKNSILPFCDNVLMGA